MFGFSQTVNIPLSAQSVVPMANDHHTPPLVVTEKRLLQKAAHYFMQKDYAEASSLYFEALSWRPNDVRVIHNLAVSQFYQNQQLQADKFQQHYLYVLSQAKISNDIHQFTMEIEKYPVFLYNLAVIYFQDHQPWKSLEFAITLLQTLCSIDSSGTCAYQRTADITSSPWKLRFSDSGALILRTRLLIGELYIALQKFDMALNVESDELCKHDFDENAALGLVGSKDLSPMKLTDVEVKMTQLKLKLKEHRALLLFSLRSATPGRDEYREYRTLVRSLSDEPGRVAVSFLKAYHNYMSGNIRKALTVVSAIPFTQSDQHFLKTGDNLTMMVNNNIGCCHYSMGKPTVAAWYFQKASQDSNREDFKDRGSLPIHCAGFDRKCVLMYNFGVSLLHARKCTQAFNVLVRCQTAFPLNPRLWLRIAECCIQIHKSENADELAWNEEKRNLFFGYTPWNKQEPISTASIADVSNPTPTLNYARHCIEVAVPLLNADTVDVGPSNPVINLSDIEAIRLSVLCAGAYIYLHLGLYADAIQFCEQLLAVPNSPTVFQYLGNLYLYEAMFRAGKFTDGTGEEVTFPERCMTLNNASNLFTDSSNVNSNSKDKTLPSPSPSMVPPPEWGPQEEANAKAIMTYNRAIALSRIGQFELALGIIDEFIGRIDFDGPIPPDFILLAIHLNLKNGNQARAGEIYQQQYSTVKSQCRGPLQSQ